MKKILCLALLVGFSYSKTGNDFLREFPFNKNVRNMTDTEWGYYCYYTGHVTGVIESSR